MTTQTLIGQGPTIQVIFPMESLHHLINTEVIKTIAHHGVSFAQVLSIAYQFVVDTHDFEHHELMRELRHADTAVAYVQHIKTMTMSLPNTLDLKYIHNQLIMMVQSLVETLRYPMLHAFNVNGITPSNLTQCFTVTCNVTHYLADAIIVNVSIDYLPF